MTGAERMRKLRATRRARSTGRTEHLHEDERCPDCGTLLILVGRFHLCRPRQAVTKLAMTKSGGRPPIGENAMTGAERMRKLRATRRARSTGRTEHLHEDERCPDCGTLLILVGRFHLCRPRQAVTKLAMTKSGGRPPIGEKAMTGAERMRKLRATRRARSTGRTEHLHEDERCPDCGTLLILVGRFHLCRPRQAVTKLAMTKSGGRPPIGENAMTGAERMRKLRATRRARSTGRTEHLHEDERCPDCGTLLILVGRFHLCRPRQAVTKFPVTKSGGRPPIGERAMTGAERMREEERCPDCGTLLILVGRAHLCQPQLAVTKLPVTKSGGRPPIGEKAITGVERMRKLRAIRRTLTRTV